jgi:hypothetical protein
VVTSGPLFRTPISCLVPRHFKQPGAGRYINNICWINNTFYLPHSKNIPTEEDMDSETVQHLYALTNFVLMAFAVLNYLPSRLWAFLGQKSGIDCKAIFDSLKTFEIVDERKRRITQKVLLNQMYSIVDSNCGRYLTICFFISKLTYIVIVFVQIIIVSVILQIDDFGFDAFRDLLQPNRNVFPWTTLCTFWIRNLGNVHRYTTQCILQINLLYRYMFIVIWMWLILVFLALIISMLFWLLRLSSGRKTWCLDHISPDEFDEGDMKLFEVFVDFLNVDGFLLLRLMDANSNNVTITEVITGFWLLYSSEKIDIGCRHLCRKKSATPVSENKLTPAIKWK